MDPDQALADIRDMIHGLRNAIDDEEFDTAIFEAEYLATAVEALDEWITGGGLLPEDWAR